MRSHADDRRRGRGGGSGARAPRALRGAVLAGGLTAAAIALAGVAGAAFKPKTVVVRDAAGDAGSGPDMARLSVGRGSDGRLRVAVTFAKSISPADLVARTGPPGSVCLRVWTASVPPNTRPDYLICVTAEANRRTLRGTVMQDRPGSLPRRVAAASVSRRGRSLVVRFSQSAVGRPSLMRFAAEATRAGCVRVSCVDTAPDAPKVSRIRLREATARAPT